MHCSEQYILLWKCRKICGEKHATYCHIIGFSRQGKDQLKKIWFSSDFLIILIHPWLSLGGSQSTFPLPSLLSWSFWSLWGLIISLVVAKTDEPFLSSRICDLVSWWASDLSQMTRANAWRANNNGTGKKSLRERRCQLASGGAFTHNKATIDESIDASHPLSTFTTQAAYK